jgi:DNA transformation protein
MGPVAVKRMFGGRAVVLDGVTFALEFRGEVYLKADADSAEALEAAGSRQFTYDRRGRAVSVGFWTLPEAAHEDPDELRRWALPALEFARRRAAAKASKPAQLQQRRRRRSPSNIN